MVFFFKENLDVFLGSSYSFLLYCVVVITYFLSIKRFQNVVIFLYFFFQNWIVIVIIIVFLLFWWTCPNSVRKKPAPVAARSSLAPVLVVGTLSQSKAAAARWWPAPVLCLPAKSHRLTSPSQFTARRFQTSLHTKDQHPLDSANQISALKWHRHLKTSSQDISS